MALSLVVGCPLPGGTATGYAPMQTLDMPCPLTAETPAGHAHVLGIGNPWSTDGMTLAVLELPSVPSPGLAGAARVCLWDPVSGAMRSVGQTRAWTPADGAWLRWLPGNALSWAVPRGDRCGGLLFDLVREERRELPHPVQALHPDGTVSVGTSPARVWHYLSGRPGGWPSAGLTAPGLLAPCPREDGLWRMDLADGACRLLVSVAEAAALGGSEEDRLCLPLSTHLLSDPAWNPSGTRLAFLHRCLDRAGGTRTRLLSCDPDGGDLRVLAGDVSGTPAWLDDGSLCVARGSGLAKPPPGRLRRRIALAAAGWRPAVRRRATVQPGLWQVDAAGATPPACLLPTQGPVTGMARHQGGWVAVATAADGRALRTASLVDLAGRRSLAVARLHAGANAAMAPSPHWDPTGTRLALETDAAGLRQVAVLDLSPALAAERRLVA